MFARGFVISSIIFLLKILESRPEEGYQTSPAAQGKDKKGDKEICLIISQTGAVK